MVNEKLPFESNWLVTRLNQLPNGVATFVAVSTAYGEFGGPLLPVKMTFVPDRLIVPKPRPAMTSMEPSARSLFVQPSPGVSGGRRMFVNPPE